ncbi:MAG: (d)CMP kinase [Oscillospiraceae bacterium]|nr:(d)CMP kinase [Oscillospiraceae bacterium]
MSEEKKFFAVALDGPSGAGKSTIARNAAKELGFLYVDTGAIYRSVAYSVWQKGIDPKNPEAVAALLPELVITIGYGEDGLQRMYVNGADVTAEIRLPEVSLYASQVSAIPAVRAFLLEMQRDMAAKDNVIMDGRDIGTVVLPGADVKIFLTASAEERAKRRYRDLREQGTPQDYGVILVEIEERDYNDSHRETAPLKCAEDAVKLDTSSLSFEESKEKVLQIIKERLHL